MSRTTRRCFALAAAIAVAVTGAPSTFSAPSPKTASLFTPEKGRFRIEVNGQQVGTEQFEIAPNGENWVARGTTEIQAEGGAMKISGTLELHADGTPERYEWSTQGPKKAAAAVSFNGPTATIQLRMEGTKPYTQIFTFSSPQIAVLDNNLYEHYAVLARLYDWQKKGLQTFSVLVPQQLTPGSVTAESLGGQDVGGKKLEELRVKTEDLELDLYLDGQRLVRIAAPGSKAEIIRE